MRQSGWAPTEDRRQLRAAFGPAST